MSGREVLLPKNVLLTKQVNLLLFEFLHFTVEIGDKRRYQVLNEPAEDNLCFISNFQRKITQENTAGFVNTKMICKE